MLTKMLLRKPAGTVAQGLTYVSSATSTGSTIVIPASSEIGDLAVLWDAAEGDSYYPDPVVPGDWTELVGLYSFTTAIIATFKVSRKKLVSGDPGTTITGMNGDLLNRKLIVILRPNNAIGTITQVEQAAEAVDTNPADQVKSTQTAPYVVIGGSYCDVAPAFSSAWADQSFTNNKLLAGYKIFNSSPASVTIGLSTYGSDNMLVSGSIKVT